MPKSFSVVKQVNYLSKSTGDFHGNDGQEERLMFSGLSLKNAKGEN